MRRGPRGALLALVLLLWTGAAGADPGTVIVLSWDGVRHDFLGRTELPAVQRVIHQGARAERMIPVFPSNTFPNHVAMATGTYVDRHGIVNNVFRDPERGRFDHGNDASWLQAEPLWSAAERQGVRSAVFFWVGSETDWNGYGARYRVAPFDGGTPESEKVDRILEWLALPEPERPRLVMSWWHGADGPGHRKGPDHRDVQAALASQDRELARLLAALDARDAWEHTTLLIVGDHGMAEVTELIDPAAALARSGIAAQVEAVAATAQVWLADPARLEDARRVLSALDGVTVYDGQGLPAELRADHVRNGHLLLVTEPPRTFYKPEGLLALLVPVQQWLGGTHGMHGYDPRHPDMATIFLALGRGVPAGANLGEVRSIDVAPTAAGLLGIAPPAQAEGRRIPGLVY
jgi:predicted AlkP superfamily pyrophosphatase or phosphodiesterase